jgi:ABC-2 type transport system permease protein
MTATTPPQTANERPSDAPTPVQPNVVRDSWNVLVRELRPVVRDPFSLIFSLLQPLVFLGLFGPLLVGNSGEPASDTLRWFVPGILVMIALFGTGATGSNLLFEMQTGSHERTLVAPISRSALLIGRALKEMVPIMVQAAVIAVATIPFGFSIDPLGMLIGLVLIAIFGMGFGALSYALALASRNKDWMFWAVQQSVIFPLMILSGMLMPLENGPEWMRAVAAVNPINYVVVAERALFAGDLMSASVLWGFVSAILLAAVGLWVGIRAMRRSH